MIRRSLTFKVFTAAWLVAVFALATFSMPYYLFRAPGMDFEFRVDEVEAVVSGVDPYDYFSLKKPSEEYFPIDRYDLRTEKRCKPIHAYPPWSYTYMLPFATNGSLMSKWYVCCAIEFACFLFMLWYAFRRGKRISGCFWDGLFAMAAVLSIGVVYGPNFGNGNFTYPMCVGLILMAECLSRKRDVLAGILWGLLMVKPQLSMLIGIPLLFDRRWKVIATAVLTCLAAGQVSASLIGKPLLSLILQIPEQGAPFYCGSVILPDIIFERLIGAGIPKSVLMYLNQAVGAGLCAWMAWKVRLSGSWLVRLVPPLVCASVWTYMNWGDRQLFFIMQIVFAEVCLSAASSRARRFCGCLIAFVFMSAFRPLDACPVLMSRIGEAIGIHGFYDIVHVVVPPFDRVAGILAFVAVAVWCVAVPHGIRLGSADGPLNR